MALLPNIHIDIHLTEKNPDQLMVLKPYQGATQYHGDKLDSDLKLSVIHEDRR